MVALDLLRELVQFARLAVAVFVEAAANRDDCLFDAALEGHRIGSGCDRLHAFAEDCLGQYRGSGGAVAGDVARLAGHFTDHLSAHVFLRVAQFNFLGYGYAVFGDGWRTEFLFDDYVAASGAEGDLHSIGENVDAAKNRLAGLFSVNNLLCHFFISSIFVCRTGLRKVSSQFSLSILSKNFRCLRFR